MRIADTGIDWSYSQIWRTISRPYACTQRSTSHGGCALLRARSSTEDAERIDSDRCWLRSLASILRKTALTKGAAERLRARLTNSTLSLIAARAGMRLSQPS